MNNHLNLIRNVGDSPLARHFKEHELNSQPPINVYILQLIRGEDKIGKELRNKWENYWIARLFTISPNGMNIQD